MVSAKQRYKLAVHDSDGNLAAMLENTYDIMVAEEYNVLPTLTFKLSADDDKAGYCVYGNEIWLYIDGSFYDCYRMDHFINSHSGGSLVLNVECVQAGDRLNEDIVQDYNATTTIQSHLTALLALQKTGSQVTLGGVDSALNLTRQFASDGVTIWKAMQELQKTVGGILYVECDSDTPTTRNLWLKEDIGEDKGQQIRYRKNLTGITRDIDYRTGIYANKIYPYGNSIQLDTSPFTEAPSKSAGDTYGYLTLPLYSCYKNWTSEGAACPSGMLLLGDDPGSYATPSSYSAPGWYDPTKAHDDDTGTYSFYITGITYGTWSGYFTYTIASTSSTAIRLYAANYYGGTENPTVEISVYSGSWEVIYSGSITKTTWVEKTFSVRWITSYRIRFYNPYAELRFPYLYESQYLNANLIGDWKQGANESVIKALLADYDPDSDYQLTYTHAPYLRNVDATKEISKVKSYETSDFQTLRGMALTDFEEMAVPYTTYEVSVIDLSQELAFEFLKLGSLIAVLDEELTITIQTRIVKITRHLDKNNIEVNLSNKARTLINTIAEIV